MIKNFDKSKCRIAVFDLDGTLLWNSLMSERTGAVLRQLRNTGMCMAVATGRPLEMIPRHVRDLNVFQYAVSCNGARVTDLASGTVLYRSTMDHSAVMSLLRTAQECHGVCNVYFPDFSVFSTGMMDVIGKKDGAEVLDRVRQESKDTVTLVEDIISYSAEAGLPAEKVDMRFLSEADFQTCMTRLSANAALELADARGWNLEATGRGVSKAAGLSALLEHLHFSWQEAAAFGDSENDLKMLQAAGFSVAMGSGAESVKLAADLVAGDASRDGAAEAICQLFQLPPV